MGENRRYPTQPTWHPIMAAREFEAGRWMMVDQVERPYGLIEIIRRGDEVGYRLTSAEKLPSDRQVLGYFRTLRASAAAAHRHYIRSSSPANANPFEGHRGTIPG